MAYIEKEPIIEFIVKGLNNPDKSEAYGYDAVEILTEIEYTPTADIAREIFEDIEQLFIDGCETYYTIEPEEYYKLKNKYKCGAKSE